MFVCYISYFYITCLYKIISWLSVKDITVILNVIMLTHDTPVYYLCITCITGNTPVYYLYYW